VDPWRSDVNLVCKCNLALDCDLLSKVVLTSPVEGHWLAIDAFCLTYNVVAELVGVSSICTVRMMAAKSQDSLQSISLQEEVSFLILEGSLNMKFLCFF
jgi:hypothetical protein